MTHKLVAGAISLIIVCLQRTSIAFLLRRAPTIYSTTKAQCLVPTCVSHLPTTTTPLSMVAKSGGKLIVSTEQFEQEVLGKTELTELAKINDSEKELIPVLVLFSAPWCGPCRLTSPVVKDVMKQYENRIEVAEISTDDLPEVASKAGVFSIPTILIYHQGEVMDTIVGCVAKNVLAKVVDKVLEDLGMLDGE